MAGFFAQLEIIIPIFLVIMKRKVAFPHQEVQSHFESLAAERGKRSEGGGGNEFARFVIQDPKRDFAKTIRGRFVAGFLQRQEKGQ